MWIFYFDSRFSYKNLCVLLNMHLKISILKGKNQNQNTVPGKDLIQNWWRNKKLFRKAKVKRIQYHQTRFPQMLKGLCSQEIWVEKDLQNQSQTIKKMAIGTYISIMTLNIKGLNAPSKNRLAEWIHKQDPYVFCLQETHVRPKNTYRLKVRGLKNIFHANEK